MARATDKVILITEPARPFITALSVRLGVSEDLEESGNRVHRFTEAELRYLSHRVGFQRPRLQRYAMYYQQKTLFISRWFEETPTFMSFRILFWLINLLFGRWGNKMIAVAER